MAKQKKKSTAAKQRAKARQQARAIAAARAPQEQPSGSTPVPASRPQPVRRPPNRAARPSKRRRSRRVPWVMVGGVVAVVGIFVVMSLANTDDTSRGNASEGSIEKLTSVPVATLDAVGVPAQPRNVNRLPEGTGLLEEDGKPVVMYIGAEYCPFCAVQRWAVVVALSRFGTWEGLESTTSGPPPETLPNTPTVTFAGATFTSELVAFSSAETETRDGQPLEELTPTQEKLVSTYNVEQVTGSNGGIPFMMMGNLYAWAGSQYDYTVLQDKDFDQIVTALQDPQTQVAKEIGGAANYLTAMICQLTDGQPADVCSSAVIQEALAALPAA